jgi:AcrR family transcriptional regulator
MAPKMSSDKAERIAEAALKTFSELGFRLTQVADVAKEAGVAPGTIYLYAKGKEDLFWLALRKAMRLPAEAESPKDMSAEDLRQRITSHGNALNLRAALDGPDAELPSLETVIRDHYRAVEQGASAIKLVERCARDWPELAHAFFFGLRQTTIANLATYLKRSVRAGTLQPMPNPEIAARLIVETIAWFAMHRRGDVDGQDMDDDAARESVVYALVNAYQRLNGHGPIDLKEPVPEKQ